MLAALFWQSAARLRMMFFRCTALVSMSAAWRQQLDPPATVQAAGAVVGRREGHVLIVYFFIVPPFEKDILFA